ncbi:hypothetical protein E0Z10_g4488 [Xylaria hypoxylon]|uniref:Uncharacterized protein n=1 Tax=Xylaria hypoxylon TaxID=37992 RepID=A0A4Z0YK75_9PEZI|nr:hypothetical protein E0Z10_g4488 [Xylaria hypoxylon]
MSASKVKSSRTHPDAGAYKPGAKNPSKHRRKKRLAKGLDEFSHFVANVAADVQESAPELAQGKWPDPNDEHLDQTEEEDTDLGPGVNCMTFTKDHAKQSSRRCVQHVEKCRHWNQVRNIRPPIPWWSK